MNETLRNWMAALLEAVRNSDAVEQERLEGELGARREEIATLDRDGLSEDEGEMLMQFEQLYPADEGGGADLLGGGGVDLPRFEEPRVEEAGDGNGGRVEEGGGGADLLGGEAGGADLLGGGGVDLPRFEEPRVEEAGEDEGERGEVEVNLDEPRNEEADPPRVEPLVEEAEVVVVEEPEVNRAVPERNERPAPNAETERRGWDAARNWAIAALLAVIAIGGLVWAFSSRDGDSVQSSATHSGSGFTKEDLKTAVEDAVKPLTDANAEEEQLAEQEDKLLTVLEGKHPDIFGKDKATVEDLVGDPPCTEMPSRPDCLLTDEQMEKAIFGE